MVSVPWDVFASTFTSKLSAYKRCWFCGPFSDLFDISNDVATELCKTLQPVFLAILGIFFLFWLVIRVGRVVIDLSPAPDTQLVPDLFKQMLRVIAASLMLVFYLEVFAYIVNPALEMAMGIGNTVTLQKLEGEQQTYSKRLPGSLVGSTSSLCSDFRNAISKATGVNGKVYYDNGAFAELNYDSNGKVFSDVTKESFVCYMRVMNASLTVGMAIGATAISGWAGSGPIDKFYHLDLLFIGVIFIGAYFLLLLSFPVKLIDPLLNLIFVSSLFPIWVVLWAFQGTKKYYEKARDIFIGVLVHFIVISVVTLMAIKVMNSALGDTSTQTALIARLRRGEDAYKVFTTTSGFGLSGKAVLLTFALAWLSSKILEKAAPIAGQFEGVIDFGASKAATAFVSAGTGLVASGGKAAVAASFHGARGAWKRAATRDDALGRATRRVSSVAVGTLAGAATAAFAPGLAVLAGASAAAVSHRFMPVPKNRPHDASWKDRSNVREFEDRENDWMVNDARGQSSSRNKRTKEWEKYDRNSQVYQEFDSASRLQNEYDRNRGAISMADKKYKFSLNSSNGTLTIEFDDQKYTVDLNGNVKNEVTHLPVDPTTAARVKEVADFQRHAESRISAHEGMLTARGP